MSYDKLLILSTAAKIFNLNKARFTLVDGSIEVTPIIAGQPDGHNHALILHLFHKADPLTVRHFYYPCSLLTGTPEEVESELEHFIWGTMKGLSHSLR